MHKHCGGVAVELPMICECPVLQPVWYQYAALMCSGSDKPCHEFTCVAAAAECGQILKSSGAKAHLVDGYAQQQQQISLKSCCGLGPSILLVPEMSRYSVQSSTAILVASSVCNQTFGWQSHDHICCDIPVQGW